MKKIQKERANAVQRYLAGESPESICASLGKTTRWLYKWVSRHTHDDPTWCEEHLGDRLAAPTARLLRQKTSWKWFG